jgi:hypothetical protein
MIRTILFLSMTLFLFASCECSYQYNVYVKNDTKQDLTIIYKAKDAESEKTLELKPGGYEMIISSPDIKTEEGCTGCQATHCNEVAEYIHATMNDTTTNTTKWCSESVKMETVDIQQGEFTITYSDSDFE